MATVVARRQRGESYRTIGEAIGVPEATCRRAAKMYTNAGKPERVLKNTPPAGAPADEAPADEVETADAGELGKMIAEVKKAADAAKAAGNLTGYASLMARLVSLLEHQRKVAPPPRVDPNDNPDFVAAKERVRKELHRLIDHNLITKVIP
jgi:hypothetical protein